MVQKGAVFSFLNQVVLEAKAQHPVRTKADCETHVPKTANILRRFRMQRRRRKRASGVLRHGR